MILRYSGSAKHAVEAAIRAIEADPTFNPSIATCPDREREVGLEAAIMEGNRPANRATISTHSLG